jgi:hypothetical protein
MGQKVNPISLRLQQTNRKFDNCWYTDYFYRKLVSRDIYLQNYINSFLKLVKYPSARFSIQYGIKNIKIYTFLCYPKQSRKYRSRMFGIFLAKRRKFQNKISFTRLVLEKKKHNVGFFRHFFFRQSLKKNDLKKISSVKKMRGNSYREKKLKFLLDSHLWSRVYNPVVLSQQRETVFFRKSLQKKSSIQLKDSGSVFLNTIYNNILLRMYQQSYSFKNSLKIHIDTILPCIDKEFFHKNRHQLVTILSLDSISSHKDIKNSNPLTSSSSFISSGFFLQSKKKIKRHKNKKANLLYFIKNLITTLFFIKMIKSSNLYHSVFESNNKIKDLRNSFDFSRQSLQKIPNIKQPKLTENSKKLIQHYENSLLVNKLTKKVFLKYFFVFYLLYTEYNRNTLYRDCILDKIFFFDIFFRHFFLRHSLKKNSLKKTVKKNQNYSHDLLQIIEKNENTINKNLLSFTDSFSSFQPISIFHSIVENKTPMNYLSNTNFSYKKKKTFCSTLDFLQGKKLHQIKGSRFSNNLLAKNREHSLVSSTLVKNNQQQELKYKNYIQRFLYSLSNINTEFLPFGVLQDWQSAGFLADEIVYFLERRVTFRRLKHKIIKKISENPNIRGIRITCSGRVGGKSKKAQRAKTECVKYGQTSRHTFSSRIDFAVRTARTRFGSVGIKVWICYH